MTDPHRLELELVDDLTTLGDQIVDEDFSRELYRTLTNMRCSKRGWPGHVSLSWQRVDEIINALRESHPAAARHRRTLRARRSRDGALGRSARTRRPSASAGAGTSASRYAARRSGTTCPSRRGRHDR
jgi:hypothetical protein